jgi:hypothetical protein
MKTIIPIVELLSELGCKRIDIISNEDSQSRYSELFKLISVGKITTDDEAAKHLFNTNANSQLYRRFKSTFKDKLINNLYFLDEQHLSLHTHQKAGLIIQKRWGAISILFQRNQSQLATQLAEQLLPTAMQYELTEVLVAMLSKIKIIYATQIGDFKKYQYFHELHERYLELYNYEQKAYSYYASIRLHYTRSESYKPELAKEALAYYQLMEPALKENPSAELYFIVNMIRLAVDAAEHNYLQILETCREGLLYFGKKTFEHRKGISVFLDIKISACTQLGLFEEGMDAGKQVIAMNQEGTINWFVGLSNCITLCFHCKHYYQAYEYYQKATSNKQYEKLQGKIHELFKLYEGYLYLLIVARKVEGISIQNANFRNMFRLNRFLNEIPTFQRDKAGMNVPVLILQIAYLLIEQKYDKAVDKIKAVELYCHRHLRTDNTLYRANCFIQALLELPRAGFHREAFVRKAKKHWERFVALPIEKAAQSYIVEIIPFEALWEYILETLPHAQRIKAAFKTKGA